MKSRGFVNVYERLKITRPTTNFTTSLHFSLQGKGPEIWRIYCVFEDKDAMVTVAVGHLWVTPLISSFSSGSVDTLKKTADRDFTFLIWATVLVAVGVLCEAGEVVHELIRWWKERGRKRSLVPIISGLGLMLVSIGVIGEGIYEAKLGEADTAIRQIDESRAQAAGDSAVRAQEAAERADAAAKGAQASADTANIAAEEIQKKVATIAKEAEAVDWSLVQVQFLSSRYIIDTARLKTGLSKFRGMVVTFRSYMNDGDGYFLCESLVPVAREAGMVSADQCGTSPASPPFITSIAVSGPDENTMLALGQTFSVETPFGASSGPYGNSPHPSNWIVFVGMKPRAFVGQSAQSRGAKLKSTGQSTRRSK